MSVLEIEIFDIDRDTDGLNNISYSIDIEMLPLCDHGNKILRRCKFIMNLHGNNFGQTFFNERSIPR